MRHIHAYRGASTSQKTAMKKKMLAILGFVLFLPVAAALYLFSSLGNHSGLSARQKSLLQQPALPSDSEIARLVVRKSAREMDAYDAQGRLLKTYPVALGFNPVGHKRFEGDGKTPEGRYAINTRNPHSGYHKNLGVSYPNAVDSAYAAAQGKSAGGDIKIHGLHNGLGAIGAQHLRRDWTNGCIAVTDGEIDELYARVKPQAVIDILP